MAGKHSLAPLFACALLAAAPAPGRTPANVGYLTRQQGCHAARTYAGLFRCSARDPNFIARDIVNGDLSGLHVINASCDSPWHVVVKATGDRGELDYESATISGAGARQIVGVPLLDGHGKRVAVLLWQVRGHSR